MIVLAGEDATDRRSLKIVLEALCPQTVGRIVEINDKVRLHQAGRTLDERVRTLARKVRAKAELVDADIASVFVHEDFDAVDSDERESTHQRVQNALRRELDCAYYVLAAWEVEAWLLLFPKALTAFAGSWVVPAKYRNKDTGKIHDPKRALVEAVSKKGPRYRESDAPEVLAQAANLALLRESVGTNSSWRQLCADVDKCCADLNS